MPKREYIQSLLPWGGVHIYIDGVWRVEAPGKVEDFTDFSNSQEEEE